jgi:hypothetical protein
MPKFHAAELTENRRLLAEMIADRDIARNAANAEVERSAKLATVHAAVEPARAALSDFDAQSAVAMSNWARGNVTGLPKSDAARRAALAADLADAELASTAAKAAQDECQSNAERFSHTLTQMEAHILERAQIVAIEEATELLPRIADAIAAAESLRLQLDAARAEAVKGLGSFGRATSVAPALEKFDTARQSAESRPLMQPVNPFANGWRKFTAALTQVTSVNVV